jgi:hypothetical protein
MDQADGEAFGIIESNQMPAPGRVCELFELACARNFCGFLQLCVAFDLEAAAEELLRTSLRVVHVLVIPIAFVPSLVLCLVSDCHAKVAEKDCDLIEVGVLVAHVY